MPVPPHTARLRFRVMTDADLDEMAALLGDPVVMHYYAAPKSRAEAAQWIERNKLRCAEHGYGLWIIETLDGEFLGDCGLTWQSVNGTPKLEVGFRVRAQQQNRGYATEAAIACLNFARERTEETELVAILHPENRASERVAQKLGMHRVADDLAGPIPVRTVYSMSL
ncbi:GNAT family N-acetyltransferase [Nesterenkonia sp. E16_7]|uniref:GNAT family N-acetyltransferase n=1 Tax=unclassified Nesterenkonia TaxID=2629769 RepID=UPI001A91B199|nr:MULTISPECIES: GNAT family N-acetyltransferase [unclassified Nesterenkonia]MBO0595197.1 GNAT family N-acetyltransferase [Nesterenkonia sp. E16_10]MBO0598922.1 GNAT family N-acetyltransferase [Nesterenkonia sp. E16_7]